MIINLLIFIISLFIIINSKKNLDHFENKYLVFDTKNEKLQSFFLKKALKEILPYSKFEVKNLKCDHYYGINYVNGKKLPLIFPLYLKKFIDKLNKKKINDYNFLGNINDKRKWINKYKTSKSIINKNLHGRGKNKFSIDENYYKTICKSKFTLTPTGDCPWSYRFFEAILCLSIPILDDNTDDIFCKDYHFFYNSEKHIYDKEKAIENYNKMIKKNFLNKNMLK